MEGKEGAHSTPAPHSIMRDIWMGSCEFIAYTYLAYASRQAV